MTDGRTEAFTVGIINKQAITVQSESLSLCRDVVVAFGATVVYRRKKVKNCCHR